MVLCLQFWSILSFLAASAETHVCQFVVLISRHIVGVDLCCYVAFVVFRFLLLVFDFWTQKTAEIFEFK